MNDFVEQCRREWKRLCVPDAVADEMAADLDADLREAEAEGVSAEEVLGGAMDPRSFAASWAAERGVVPPPRSTAKLRRGPIVLAVLAAFTLLAAVGAALVIFASPAVSEPTAVRLPPEFARPRPPTAVAVLRLGAPERFRVATAPVGVWIQHDGRGVVLAQPMSSGVEINDAGSILLIAGIAGIIASLPLLL